MVDIEAVYRQVAELKQYRAKVAELKASGVKFDAFYHSGRGSRIRVYKVQAPAKTKRPACGALCRSGRPCAARVVVRADNTLAKRCRLHGGLSTGPRSAEGRASIVESNRRRAKVDKS